MNVYSPHPPWPAEHPAGADHPDRAAGFASRAALRTFTVTAEGWRRRSGGIETRHRSGRSRYASEPAYERLGDHLQGGGAECCQTGIRATRFVHMGKVAPALRKLKLRKKSSWMPEPAGHFAWC